MIKILLLQTVIDTQDETKAFVKELLKKVNDKNSDATWLIGVIVVNILVSIAGLVSQFVLKNKDKEIYKFTIRENKRLETCEKLYSILCSMTYDDSRVAGEQQSLLNKLQNVDRMCMNEGLYLNEKILSNIIEWSDYYKSVVVDYRKKQYDKEEEMRKKFINSFNK